MEFRMRLFSLAAALMIGLTALAAPSAAQDALLLDDAAKAQLIATPKLREGGPDLAALGRRPVLVTFFASWCPPCAAEFAQLTQFIADEGENEVDIIAVNWIESLTGKPNARLARMMGRIHPSIAVVEGTDALDR
jgi:thiol-disulfide isomerase/thioredoxin